VGARGFSETFAPGLIAIPALAGRNVPEMGFGIAVGFMAMPPVRPPRPGEVGRMPPGLIAGGLIAGPGRVTPPAGVRIGGRTGGKGRGIGRITGGAVRTGDRHRWAAVSETAEVTQTIMRIAIVIDLNRSAINPPSTIPCRFVAWLWHNSSRDLCGGIAMASFRRQVMCCALPLLVMSFFAEVPAQGQRRRVGNIFQQMLKQAQEEARRRKTQPQRQQPAPYPMPETTQRQVATAPAAIAQCDSLAGHPDDPSRKGAGVLDENVDLVAALRECTQAVSLASAGDSARIMFQTGRVLWLAEEFEEAMPFLLDAAEANEPAAMAYIGDAYANGLGGAEQDLEIALAFYAQSAAAGFAPANAMADELAAELTTPDTREVQITAATAQAVNECDRLSAHPSDPKKLASGIPDASFDAPKAIAACAAATAKFPGTARLDYQYGRALYLDGQIETALPSLASAAEKGHAAAKAILGDIFLAGDAGQDQDFGAAYSYYSEAAAAGFAPAALAAAEIKKAVSVDASPTANSLLRLSCEVVWTHSAPSTGPMQIETAKFDIALNFETGKAKYSGGTVHVGDYSVFFIDRTYGFTGDESSLVIDTDKLGPEVRENNVTVNLNDGKIYMQQAFKVGEFFGASMFNFMTFDGYCGEKSAAPAAKKTSAPSKKKA